jgi:large subunit ribosomal protein L13
MNKTFSPKPADVEEARKWYVIDATGLTLGRIATEVAHVLRGKHKAIYSPHMDTGDNVVVINAEKLVVTGNKAADKLYYRHSGYPGGFRATTFEDRMKRHPTWPIYDAVRGMLPHNRLGRAMIKKLRVYEGAEHPHGAQQPEELKLKYHEVKG